MRTYVIITPNNNWYEVQAESFFSAYFSEKVWFTENRMIVMDKETNETRYFDTREEK